MSQCSDFALPTDQLLISFHQKQSTSIKYLWFQRTCLNVVQTNCFLNILISHEFQKYFDKTQHPFCLGRSTLRPDQPHVEIENKKGGSYNRECIAASRQPKFYLLRCHAAAAIQAPNKAFRQPRSTRLPRSTREGFPSSSSSCPFFQQCYQSTRLQIS